MKYFSEITKKFYDNADACLAAEKEVEDLNNAKSASKKEVDEAINNVLKLLKEYTSTYGTYEYTIEDDCEDDKTDSLTASDIFDFVTRLMR